MVIKPMARAVFLDRDGVLNRAIRVKGHARPPAGLEELEILPGVSQALQMLKRHGYWLIVVTNQPDVARGVQTRAMVETLNVTLTACLPLDEIRVCYHDDADDCGCRKPRPGLLQQAAHAHGIDLSASFMVGDRWRDIEAGHRAGCKTILVDYSYSEEIPRPPDHVVHSLSEAAQWILEQSDNPGDLH